MADVFASYASEDRARVAPIIAALEAEGLTVWWDQRIDIGAGFDRVIERELESCACVVVFWSAASVDSEWVRAEAQEGIDRKILVPVLLDDVRPPLVFRRMQAANFSRKRPGPEMERLVAAVNSHVHAEQRTGAAPQTVLLAPKRSSRSTSLKSSWIGALGVVIVIAGAGLWLAAGEARRARSALPELEALVANGRTEEAYMLAREIEASLPKEPALEQIWAVLGWRTSIDSSPPGAAVYRRAYEIDSHGSEDWIRLGTTPIDEVRVPVGPSVLRFELDGHEKMVRVIGGAPGPIPDLPVGDEQTELAFRVLPGNFQMDRERPKGTVRVPSAEVPLNGGAIAIKDFFLGRHEVTNAQFKVFVDSGGYRRQDLWAHDIIDGESLIPWSEAMARFVDRSGRPGPSTWEGGHFKAREGDYPVGGVSWYEAAAFARFAGSDLPTIHQWRRAFAPGLLPWQLRASNLEGSGSRPVGSGLGWTGTYDMAGNVREWCFNAVGKERIIVGGAWTDPPYVVEESVSDPATLPPLDRSPENGFRLMIASDPEPVSAKLQAPILFRQRPNVPEPVSDSDYATLAAAFDYDAGPLEATVESRESYLHWDRERVSFDAESGTTRIPMYLFLPKDGAPFHTVLLWPTTASMLLDSVDDVHMHLDFVLRNRRAVALPVMEGTFERRLANRPSWSTIAGRDLAIRQMREFRRAIDYLESRPDLRTDGLAYFGFSWGGRMGGIALAVEARFKAGILNQAGLSPFVHADIDVVHYLPRVSVPVLQFNGLYDTDFRYETSAKPFFELIGTPEHLKRHHVGQSGHFVPRQVLVGDTLDWLDAYASGGKR